VWYLFDRGSVQYSMGKITIWNDEKARCLSSDTGYAYTDDCSRPTYETYALYRV
jgi:hypothetical protein